MSEPALAPLPLTDVIAHLDELLEPAAFDDFGPNGLQVPGTATVRRVVTGVSANVALIERTLELNAELLVVHHGLIWDFQPSRLTRQRAHRLRLALQAELNVAMYHLPLDAHPSLGNNAVLANALGAQDDVPFGRVRGRHVGRLATFTPSLGVDDLIERVTRACDREPLVFRSGPERIERLAILSGAGANQIGQAIEAGADAYLTGEPSEHVMAEAAEGGITFIAAGHHATERFGVQALGAELARQFALRTEFVDVPNPV